MKVATIIGTRPEIIKMSRLVPLLDKSFDHYFIFTNQHYSQNMVDVFFEELEVRKPDELLQVQSSDISVLTAKVKEALLKNKIDKVIVYGDTNSTIASALAAKELGIEIAHVEAGLRCFDSRLPEEGNRIKTDGLSSYLFAPTALSEYFLKEDKIKGKIFVVGNTVVDACKYYVKKAEKTDILGRLGIRPKEYIVATAHRQETVDKKECLAQLVKAFKMIGEKIIYPIHPRTLKNLNAFGLKLPKNVKTIGPVGYFEILQLMKNASLVLTDSGGMQEEAITLGVPCLTMREATERWGTVLTGGNILTGISPHLISYCAKMMLNPDAQKKMRRLENPYGNGTTSEQIAKILKSEWK